MLIALEVAAVFGWTLDQVLGLTWPQFSEVSTKTEALRTRRAQCEVFFGVAAALDNGAKDNLFASAPSLLREPAAPVFSFTPEQLEKAERRAQELTAGRV